MKIVKFVLLNVLLMIAMIACGTIVMWLFDALFAMKYSSVIVSGVKVGLIAWAILAVEQVIKLIRNNSKKES